MRLRAIDDLGDISGKRVFVRVDFNVPLADGVIGDDMRIRAALPTLNELLDKGASLVLASHLGRPKGKVVEELRLAPVATRAAELLGREITALPDILLPEVQETCDGLQPGQIVMLENLRFHPGEEANDPVFADALARLADMCVNDAFGAAHRAHASVVGVETRLPSAAGRLLQREVEVLTTLLTDAERPFVAILGGAKVSDKLSTITSIIPKVDALLIGGAMAFTFMAAEGAQTGKSLVETDRYDDVRAAKKLASELGVLIQLPEDAVVAEEISADAHKRTVNVREIPPNQMGLDIGPRSVEEFARTIADARTILWNGPMGVFELEPFSAGTRGVAMAVAGSTAFSVVGGGDSLAAIRKFELEDSISHLSTGGGASLEFLEGKVLPGVAVLEEG